jgi:hypothetical protein
MFFQDADAATGSDEAVVTPAADDAAATDGAAAPASGDAA